MSDSNSQLSGLQHLLPRAVTGDEVAVDALLRHCSDRLTILTRRMLGDFQRLRRWVETDDVLQNALLRLLGALRSVQPQTPRAFFALASLQIRRELIDLARHFYGPEGIGANHDSQKPAGSSSSSGHDPAEVRQEPTSVAQWAELHELADRLPAEEREVVGLLFYQGLSQAEAADVLSVSLRTVQRRWHDALWRLHRAWTGE
ncbi:MAG: sigma-70 family RNA polymerase sigma factor [Gemmataceae bacterium]|nr:sigma-70 family RNA polymerase sigma factor [Gemmataceae bacterium]